MNRKAAQDKIITYDQMFDMINPGSRIFFSTGAAIPAQTVSKILKSKHPNLVDLEFIHLITMDDSFNDKEAVKDKYRLKTLIVGEAIGKDVEAGKIDFVPSNLSEIPYLFASEAIGVDVAIIQTSQPDPGGFLNLGIITVVADIIIKKAPLVIAEINPHVPCTHGETSIHMNQIDYIVESDRPLATIQTKKYNTVSNRIGWHISNLIEDNSTVSLHAGSLFDAIAAHLKNKKGLRIYSHVVSDWAIDLIESGAIALDRGENYQRAVTCSCCFGTERLYSYVNNNPSFEFAPLLRSTYQSNISKINKLIGIINVKKIDISGEVVALYSTDSKLFGFDSKLNFSIAAIQSRGGKAIVAVNSVDQQGNSNIVIKHKNDSALIRSTLGTTQYVATEYGVANIMGKSIRERTLAMIDIAHPDHREKLLHEAKSMGYLYPDQIYILEHAIHYPFNLETIKTFPDGLEVKFRPIKACDEDLMRRLFYQFSKETRYLRYFSVIQTMPHNRMQPYVHIDYDKTLSIVGIISHRGSEKIIAEARYSYDRGEDAYEMAFVVDEHYQGKGIGSFLLMYLFFIAKDRGIHRLFGTVLTENTNMRKMFNNAPVKPSQLHEEDDDVIQYIFDLG